MKSIEEGTATILLGDGKGNLSKPANVLVATGPVAVLSGDYNRDGKRDFLTLNGNAATISVFFGYGKTFQVETGLPVPTRADQLVLADFNEDGIPDIATANSGIDSLNGNTASVLIRKKGGGLINEDVMPTNSARLPTSCLATATEHFRRWRKSMPGEAMSLLRSSRVT